MQNVITNHIYDSVLTFPVGGEEFIQKDGSRFTVYPETGVRVMDNLGQVWEYKGISAFKGDMMFRVRGWERYENLSK